MIFYEDLINDKKANLLLLIFIIVSLIMPYLALYQEDLDSLIRIIIWALFIILEGSLLYVFLSNIINSNKNRKLVNEIKEKGVKHKGKVLDIKRTLKFNYKDKLLKKALFFSRTTFHNNDLSRERVYYYAVVKYNDEVITTSPLLFDKNDLLSDDVDVYSYNGLCYVDNFKVKENKLKK